MIHPGLVSISFRKLTPEALVALVVQGGLKGIEWGGDVHVPHGDTARAEAVRKLTLDAGLSVAAYGSYYRAGEENEMTFEQVVQSAAALGAPTIRAWAGKRSPADADDADRAGVVAEARQMAEAAAAAGMTLSFEYHRKTLTETDAAARAFYCDVDHPAVRAYWQPPIDWTREQRLEGLRGVQSILSHLHVYHWRAGTERRPIAEGMDDWRAYLDVVRDDGRTHCALIEFVKDDAPEQFLADAAALRELTAGR